MTSRCAALLPALLLWSAPVFAADPPEAPAAPTPRAVPTASVLELNTPMTVGLTMFSLSYAPCLITGVAAEDGDAIPLVLPVAGPWITAHLVQPEDWAWAFFGGLSGLQALGAGIFAFGALLPRDPTTKRSAPRSPTVSATPVLGPAAWGLSVQGSF